MKQLAELKQQLAASMLDSQNNAMQKQVVTSEVVNKHLIVFMLLNNECNRV
jgi:hypothetical protein